MGRVSLFVVLLLLVALLGAAAALLTVDVAPPARTIEKVVPDARIGS